MPVLTIINKLIEDILSEENICRKDVSLAEFEIYQDNLRPYVKNYLGKLYDNATLDNMPVIASINLASRIVNQEASIYKIAPTRTFLNVSDEQKAVLEQIYSDLQLDKKMLKSNRYFKLQGQNHIQILPENKKLRARILLNHHIDSIPNEMNPEKADGYLVSGFDKSLSQLRKQAGDGNNQTTGDADDYKSNMRIAVWTKDENFIVDGKGNLITDLDKLKNDLGILPFVEIAPDKDFEYWIRRGQVVTDFTIQFNGALSDLGHIVRMQGFAQAWLSGPSNMIPENVQVGPSFVLKLPKDPNNPVDTEFGFANPSPDLGGSIQYIEMLLSNFLTAKGLDPKLISGKADGQHFSSGLERLLAMIDSFDASRSDLATYEQAENEIFEIVKKYIEVYSGTDVLGYKIAKLPENASVLVSYNKPEMVQSESEKLDSINKKIEMGLLDKIGAFAEFHGLTDEDAENKLLEISQRKLDLQLEMKKQADAMAKKFAPPPDDPNNPNPNPVGNTGNPDDQVIDG